MANKKLKPCPFCGGGATEIYATSEWWPKDRKEYTAECGNKECLVITVTRGFGTRNRAIKAWNRRVNGKE